MKQAILILVLATVVALFLAQSALAAPPWMDRTDDVCVASAHVEALEGLDLDTGLVADWGLRTDSGVLVFWYSIDWCHGWAPL
jgi:hypothetical protein